MPGRTRQHLPLIVAVLVMACGAPSPAAGAARERACELSLRDQEHPGRTPAYGLALATRGATCAMAARVMHAFHRCRGAGGTRCGRRVLGRWRCAGATNGARPTFRGAFTCRSGGRLVRGRYREDTPACFGAAARDPELPCANPTRSLFPPPGKGDPDRTWMCTEMVGDACSIGLSSRRARASFALVGDSHSLGWRPALNVVAQVERWRGYAIDTGGCFFSAVVASFLPGCVPWYDAVLAFVRRHPEIRTVFVTQNADTFVAVPDGQTILDHKVDGFLRAWKALPPTVEHVVVLRDTTLATSETFDCVYRVAAEGLRRPGTACPLARSIALRPDAAVEAVRRERSSRYEAIDLTRFLCGPRNCYPVVGGALVNGDVLGHVNPTFMRTLGPYLLRELRRLMASW